MTSIKPVLSIASVQDQCDLGSANTDNKLLQYRGNAGTHDLKLGSDTLVALRDLNENGSKMRVPRWVHKMYEATEMCMYVCVCGGDQSTSPIAIFLPLLGWIGGAHHVQAIDPYLVIFRYDKSAFAGRGDRAPESQWPVIEGPVDIVLFEGWMSGFSALPDGKVRTRSCCGSRVCGATTMVNCWVNMDRVATSSEHG